MPKKKKSWVEKFMKNYTDTESASANSFRVKHEDENMKLSAKEYNEFLESVYVNKKHLNQTLTSLTGDNFEKVLRLK